MKESWSLFAVKKHWAKPTLLDFNDWLKEKAEAHYLKKNTAIKTKTEETINPVTKPRVASKAFAANTQQKKVFKTATDYFVNVYPTLHRMQGQSSAVVLCV